MVRINPLPAVAFAAVLGASHGALAASATTDGRAAVEAQPPAVAGPESAGRPAGATSLACFGGLDDGQAILRAGTSGGRFGGTTARSCRANGGRALRALRSPAIAAGRPIVA